MEQGTIALTKVKRTEYILEFRTMAKYDLVFRIMAIVRPDLTLDIISFTIAV